MFFPALRAPALSYFLEWTRRPESVYRQAAVQCIIVGRDLSSTFCQLALSSDDLGRADRNIINASKLCRQPRARRSALLFVCKTNRSLTRKSCM
jgi:hypothetical protein